jgi:hypothetical protein
LEDELIKLLRITLNLDFQTCTSVPYPSRKPYLFRKAIDRWTKPNALNSALKHDAKAFGMG